MQGGFLPAVNPQLGFHVKGHVPTIDEAEEARDPPTQRKQPSWRISSSSSLAPSSNHASTNTGVKGLLDLCESSSMPRPAIDGVPASSLVEVVGMAQSSNGVRRLVKSVVYGLKACQVKLPVILWSNGAHCSVSCKGPCGKSFACTDVSIQCTGAGGKPGRPGRDILLYG